MVKSILIITYSVFRPAFCPAQLATPLHVIPRKTVQCHWQIIYLQITKIRLTEPQNKQNTNTINIYKTYSVFWPAFCPAQPPHCAVYHEKPFSAVDRHIDCSPVTQPIISYTFFLVLFYHSALLPLFVVLLKRIIWRIVSGKTVKYPWLISESG